jgi:hypothetical protein
MNLKKLPRSIIHAIGIFVFSALCLIQPGARLWSETGEQPDRQRTFEVQFHSANISGKLSHRYLHEMGIDKVIVRVFQDKADSGGLYFLNSIFRVISPFLDRLIPEFISQPVDLYAWMITRRFNWVGNDSFFDYMVKNGSRYRVRKFDIFNPDAIKKIIAVYRELAAKPIKGILLQDDFFLRYNEGFSNWGKAVFTHSTGYPADESLMMNPGTQSGRYWKQVKVDQIIKVLNMIIRACKHINPDIKIGMNVHYETPYFIQRARAWYSHDLARLAGTDIDYIYLMLYHRQMKKEMKLSEPQNRELFEKIVKNALKICKDKLVVKLQCRDWDTAGLIPIVELKSYLDLIPLPVRRVCLTPVKSHDFYYLKTLIKSDAGRFSDSAEQ